MRLHLKEIFNKEDIQVFRISKEINDYLQLGKHSQKLIEREQQLIDMHGGAKSMGGSSGNAINGISQNNPNRLYYINQANKEF